MDNSILKRVKEHRDFAENFLKNHGYIHVATFLIGSQNYNTDTEHSDVDTVSVAVPTFQTAALGLKQLSTTLNMNNGEHCVVKDIRDYFNNGIKKQNINFVETLFTEYYSVSPEWSWLVESLRENGEFLAHYSYKRTVLATIGMVHNYSDNFRKIVYDKKTVRNLFRLNDFLHNYLDGHKYCDSIKIEAESLVNLSSFINEANWIYDPKGENECVNCSFFDTFIKDFKNYILDLEKEWREKPDDCDTEVDEYLYEMTMTFMMGAWRRHVGFVWDGERDKI